MRPYATTLILALTIFIGELHKFWEYDSTVQNWIIAEYRPMLIKWNMKYLEVEVSVIAYFCAWLLYIPNKVNRTTIWAMFWLAVMDVVLYFYNYKTHGFGAVYYWFAAFWIISFYWNRATNWLWHHIHQPK